MHTFYSPIAGCRVRWHDLPGSGMPIIFIAGIGCTASYDYPRIVADPEFAAHRAILIDLPGSGYSEKPRNYGYTTGEQARVVSELIAHLALSKVLIYGHSMGGSIAIELAALLGKSLGGLIVSEPNLRPGGGQFSTLIAAGDEAEFISGDYARLLAAENGPWSGSLATWAPWALWRSARSLVAGQTDWLDLLARLPVNTEVLFGRESLPDADFSRLAARHIPTRILENCGHSMAWENPPALAAAISQFCQAVEPSL